MGETIRFGISIDDKLLESFDRLIEQKGYMNRSEAIRDLIRRISGGSGPLPPSAGTSPASAASPK